MKNQKVSITRHYVAGRTAHCKLKNSIVIRVATSLDFNVHFHPGRFARQSGQESSHIFFIDIPPKLFAAQNFGQLGE